MGPGTRDQVPPDLPLRVAFPSLPSLRSEWNISPELFNALLSWLDEDREAAGRKYEDIRSRLIKIFVCRGCLCPEDLADETINRVTVKVGEIRAQYRGDPGRYFGGVARNVYHEYARRRPVPEPPPRPDSSIADTRAMDCLEECLDDISEANRNLILRYYEGERRTRIRSRSDMARELGSEPNALRIRICRIRAALQQCVGACLERNAG